MTRPCSSCSIQIPRSQWRTWLACVVGGLRRHLASLARGPRALQVIPVCLAFCIGHVVRADDAAQKVEFFEKKIRPVLAEHCYSCHSAKAEKLKGGLYVDNRDGLLKGGSSGPAIVPGRPEKSILIKDLKSTNPDDMMPPKGDRLPPHVIADFEAWIRMGAPDPRTQAMAKTKYSNPKDSGKSHWAYQPVKKSAPPSVKNSEWAKTPVDNFILAKLEEKGMKPNDPADPRTLLRRAYFDLIGLPPTPAEVDAFLKDTSPDAFKNVVEQLLKSPQYGERWGRYWLDVGRYSDTKGSVKRNREDDKLPYAWTYRDYVIKAFNDDKPYNRFIVEQLAADRITLGSDKSALAAMGFWLHVMPPGFAAPLVALCAVGGHLHRLPRQQQPRRWRWRHRWPI